jgi:hypothetical protein
MQTWLIGLGVLLATACNIESSEVVGGAGSDGCDGGESLGGQGGTAGGPSAGGAAGAGLGLSGIGASAGSAGSAGVAGTGGAPPCSQEGDCAPGTNCDRAQGICLPSDHETCEELTLEAECTTRADCETVYAGVDCSCGRNCVCVGGQPGCVCKSFEFFECTTGAR